MRDEERRGWMKMKRNRLKILFLIKVTNFTKAPRLAEVFNKAVMLCDGHF
jgi:hypothetical protein